MFVVCELVHPTKAAGWNKMPFGRDIHVVMGTLFRQGPQTPWEGEIWGSQPPVLSKAAYYQISLALVV